MVTTLVRPVGTGGAVMEVGRSGRGRLGSVHVGLLLSFCDVLLVSDPLVSEPVRYLEEDVMV